MRKRVELDSAGSVKRVRVERGCAALSLPKTALTGGGNGEHRGDRGRGAAGWAGAIVVAERNLDAGAILASFPPTGGLRCPVGPGVTPTPARPGDLPHPASSRRGPHPCFASAPNAVSTDATS
jgi:hypothetical protein